MKQVTKQEFFSAIGPQDVHPSVRPETLKGRYSTSDWKRQNGNLVGQSISDMWNISKTRFFLK